MVKEICREILRRLEEVHIKRIDGYELLQISSHYAGLWLEHVYDAIIYSELDPSKLSLAKSAVEVFIDHQIDGQYPFNVSERDGRVKYGYSQIQECVSFLTLASEVAERLRDEEFYRKIYRSGKAWIDWLRTHRMTRGEGLVEMFVGYDTGHDRSPRHAGLSCETAYFLPNGERASAASLPPNDPVAPIIAVDMNCNYYANLVALAKIAEHLGLSDEARAWREDAAFVKKRLFDICFDAEDCFFYDVDKHGNMRKCLSSAVLHLFLEGVLDPREDAALISELIARHLKREGEFWCNYPFPSVAPSDPATVGHAERNCWGYYTQGLIVLRCIRWMDRYGLSRELDHILSRWVEAWSRCYPYFKLGQEIDPISGEPTRSSEWYSSTMLSYLYAAERLSLLK